MNISECSLLALKCQDDSPKILHLTNIYNNVITCILWRKILAGRTHFDASALRLPCIVIIASLHHISCGIVIIHLAIANSQVTM